MSESNLRIRLRSGQTEIEVEGDREVVGEWFERLRALFSAVPQGCGDQANIKDDKLPDNFGQYLHQFASDLTDQDRMLIAGLYSQRSSSSNQFTTAEANELLKQQSVKVANPSQSILRNKDARRLFKVGDGAFRVSAEGIQYLQSLRSDALEIENVG